ncbi:MAG: hypothetical protein ABGX16_01160 [Pirellulales bacterium]
MPLLLTGQGFDTSFIFGQAELLELVLEVDDSTHVALSQPAMVLVGDTLPGDYSLNGIVDAADYTIWRDTLGSTTDLRADGNFDNVVDQEDYDYWRVRFGNTLPVNAVAAVSTSDDAINGAVDTADYDDTLTASQNINITNPSPSDEKQAGAERTSIINGLFNTLGLSIKSPVTSLRAPSRDSNTVGDICGNRYSQDTAVRRDITLLAQLRNHDSKNLVASRRMHDENPHRRQKSNGEKDYLLALDTFMEIETWPDYFGEYE